jgi:3-methyladenine DNA glycosylase/8-oxoguanine DNA glycosylase
VNQEIHMTEVIVEPFDLGATMSMQLLGRFDPTGARRPRAFLKVHLDGAGSAAVWRLTRTASGLRVETQGAAADTVRAFIAQLSRADGAAEFRPAHPLLRRLAGFRGLRLLRMPWPWDVAAGTVLQQRVRWQVAYGDFRRIALRWGARLEAATPFPTAERLAALRPCQLEAVGIDGMRARALLALARAHAARPFLLPDSDASMVSERLLRVPGIGPWTTGMILGYAYGEPDALPVGDLHLPSIVASALAGESDGTDERMIELLEPTRPHRFRVIRLLLWATRHARHLLVQPHN